MNEVKLIDGKLGLRCFFPVHRLDLILGRNIMAKINCFKFRLGWNTKRWREKSARSKEAKGKSSNETIFILIHCNMMVLNKYNNNNLC